MCGLFTSIFGEDFVWSSLILLVGEILYMIVFSYFSTNELKESMMEILEEEEDLSEEQKLSMRLLKCHKDNKSHKTDDKFKQEKHKLVLKYAYLHPFEKHVQE
jgi:hypothetical protein